MQRLSSRCSGSNSGVPGNNVMIGAAIKQAVENAIEPYETSRLARLVKEGEGPYVTKFVKSRWAANYLTASQLKISDTPALTWGTATYVTPLVFPLSSALYGRIGLVTDFDPSGWRIFDATVPASRRAYVQWVRVQPCFSDLLLTVHSTQANHLLRNKFRKDFQIDCVLFHPDQEADLHTAASCNTRNPGSCICPASTSVERTTQAVRLPAGVGCHAGR
jgi:hypothetical protein